MQTALIGHSGFVGSTLLKQFEFKHCYRSSNINEISGKEFDLVVCAGAPAQKWIANLEPLQDEAKLNSLISSLQNVKARRFVLISTVDVFKNPVNVNELTNVDETNLMPYGLHRRQLEKFVENTFEDHLIVRLPGLVGPGLKKNIIYDLLNSNNLSKIDSRGVFQFYPMVNLWYDIGIALNENIKLLHLTSEPISVSEIAFHAFNRKFDNILHSSPLEYDFRTNYANLFNSRGNYQYSKKESLLAIRAYSQSETRNSI